MLALGIETESEETRKDMMKRLEGQKISRNAIFLYHEVFALQVFDRIALRV